MKFAIPFLLFAALVAFFAVGLTRDPREVPSPLIGKPAPAFEIAQLHDAKASFKPEAMKGRAWMLNVWASWCASCRIEHPLLVELARRNVVPIVGLNYKDKREDATGWLERYGNPYALSVWDIDGRVGIDYGVYGAPETFVIDKTGVIRYKHIGPVTPEALDKTILPLLRSLQ